MRLVEPDADVLARARAGGRDDIERLLAALQPGLHAYARRMLGDADDAADATQDILLKVARHVGGFRGESAFTTWVLGIARHHLLNVRMRAPAEASLDALGARLDEGLAFARGLDPDARALQPDDKAEAVEVALGCTQSMLLALDRAHREAYVLDLVFDLRSDEAGAVLGISAAAYRQRLARARARLEGFVSRRCGLASPDAACRCERQLPAVRARRARDGRPAPALRPRDEAERLFEAFARLGTAAAVFRAQPDYAVPERMRAGIRALLDASGFAAGRADA